VGDRKSCFYSQGVGKVSGRKKGEGGCGWKPGPELGPCVGKKRKEKGKRKY